MEEKKRIVKERAEKRRADFLARKENSSQLFQVQDKYLESIAEINKMSAEMGMPQIRTEIRYTKATPEIGVDNMQVVWPELPKEEQ